MSLSIHIGLLLALPILGSLASKPDFYYFPPSPPSRIVWMTLKALGIDANMKETNIIQGDHLQPEFIKMNPRHTIPTLVDNGFILTERYVFWNDIMNPARAIATYLADSHPNGEKLYPKDLKKRARIDEMLYFDIGRLYQDFMDLFVPMMWFGKPYDQERANRLDEAFKYLEHYLGQAEWAAGDEMSLADISLVASVSTAEACNFDVNKYPKVAKWYAKCKSAIPGYAEANQVGADMFHQFFLASTAP